jgi:hypothetical protein
MKPPTDLPGFTENYRYFSAQTGVLILKNLISKREAASTAVWRSGYGPRSFGHAVMCAPWVRGGGGPQHFSSIHTISAGWSFFP